MRTQIARLREHVEIVGTAAHGPGPLHPSNLSIWAAGYTPQDFGLEYEAYHLHRAHGAYLSDNRGVLDQPLELHGERQTHLSLHPCHWDLDTALVAAA